MESESESSLDSGPTGMLPPSPLSREQLQKRIESLTQQNKVLKAEMDATKNKCKMMQEENRTLRQASVIIQAKAEQEEEYISNTLIKKIQALKKEKETLAHHYEREEECLTNDLSRKLDQLRQEKCKLEQTLEQEQECLVNKLMRKIEKLQAETDNKQTNLDQLRREMVELENTLEQEQEALVNKLWKRMDKLETEKRTLQMKLAQPVSDPTTPRDINTNGDTTDTASNLSAHIQTLRSEIVRLRANLAAAQKETTKKMQQFAQEEKSIREENARLQRKLKLEVERREALCRQLSESESSLDMDEERFYNDSLMASNSATSLGSVGGLGGISGNGGGIITGNAAAVSAHRQRTISSPVSHSPSNSRPLSPGTSQQNRCYACGQIVNRRASERFIKPALPTGPMLGLNTSAPNVLNANSLMASASTGNNSASSISNSGIGGVAAASNAAPVGIMAANNTTLPFGTNADAGFLTNLNSELNRFLDSNTNNGTVIVGNIDNFTSSGNATGVTQQMTSLATNLGATSNPMNISSSNNSSSSSLNIMDTTGNITTGGDGVGILTNSTPTNTNPSSAVATTFSFAQPASPMDTSTTVYKD